MNREEAKKLIQQGTTELNEALQNGRSETLERCLDVLSRFHRYSFNNAILIAIQNPDATHVAGFRTWKQLGRSVMNGEKSIGIIAPIAYQKKDDQGSDDDDGIRGFKVVHVFDVSRTEGDDLPSGTGSLCGVFGAKWACPPLFPNGDTSPTRPRDNPLLAQRACIRTTALSESLDHIQKTAAVILDGIANHSTDDEVAASMRTAVIDKGWSSPRSRVEKSFR